MSSRSRTIQIRIDYGSLSDLRRVGEVKQSVERVLEDLRIRIEHELAVLIAREPELKALAVPSVYDLGP